MKSFVNNYVAFIFTAYISVSTICGTSVQITACCLSQCFILHMTLPKTRTRSRSDVKSWYLFEREVCFRNSETFLQKLKMNVCWNKCFQWKVKKISLPRLVICSYLLSNVMESLILLGILLGCLKLNNSNPILKVNFNLFTFTLTSFYFTRL